MDYRPEFHERHLNCGCLVAIAITAVVWAVGIFLIIAAFAPLD